MTNRKPSLRKASFSEWRKRNPKAYRAMPLNYLTDPLSVPVIRLHSADKKKAALGLSYGRLPFALGIISEPGKIA